MKKILIINQSANYLTLDIAKAFLSSKKYDEIAVMVGNPQAVAPLEEFGIKIDTITPYSRVSIKSRFKTWIAATWQIVRKVNRYYKDYELFLVSNPPTVSFATIFLKNKYSTLIYDVYPNGLSDSGFITTSNIIYRLWAKRNIKFYEKAEYVYTITEGMRQSISAYCPKDKIEVVELWGNQSLPIVNVNQEVNKFIVDNKLVGRFIIMYSGNMGRGHDLDVLVDVAVRLQDNKNIIFIFVGDGYLKPIIKRKVDEYQLKNVLLLPYQDLSMLPYSLSSSDLAIVSTNNKSGKVCIPSKTFDLIRLGRPILCVAEKDSDISLFVRKHKVGESYSRDECDSIAEFILDLYNNPNKKKQYMEASYKASQYYTPELANKFVK